MRAKSKYLHALERYRARHRKVIAVLTVLSLVVAIGVVWQLRLHGVTMAPEAHCGLEEHVHTEACQDPRNSVLNCTLESLNIHTHTAACNDGLGNRICNKADFVLHQHDNSCFAADGALLCTLPEVFSHSHDDSCYTAQELVLDPGHTHESGCYDPDTGDLTCTQPESAPVTEFGEPMLTCQIPENLPHVHDESCTQLDPQFGNQVYVCGKPEILTHRHGETCFVPGIGCGLEAHTHEKQCYSDPNADLETPDQWSANFSGKTLSGQWPADVVTVAQSQLGYRESEWNYTVLADGSTRGYTRYGHWYGDPYGEWDAMFASFVLHYAGVSESYIPRSADAASWQTVLTNAGYFHPLSESLPEPGDLLFFDLNGDGAADRVAIVSQITETNLTAIEGGWEGVVSRREYALDAPELLGYADISAAQDLFQRNGEPVDSTLEHPVTLYADNTYTLLRSDDVSLTVIGALPEGAVARAYPGQTADEYRIPLADYHISVTLADGTPYVPEEPLSIRVSGAFETEFLEVHFITESGEYQRLEFTRTDADVTFPCAAFGSYLVSDAAPLQSIAEPSDIDYIDDEFIHYWEQFMQVQSGELSSGYAPNGLIPFSMMSTMALEVPADKDQVISAGGDNAEATDQGVYIAKILEATELENVFDITLAVSTTTSIEELQKDPDMAVVVVMDISNTMKTAFSGAASRYAAAVSAAEDFIDRFTQATSNVSRIGFVAFNTDAHEIFPLSTCQNQTAANTLKNTMRTKTANIINGANYAESHKRFTNIEGGLKRAYDMLAGVSNENKFIVFLSDGFPTTYLNNSASGYVGYDPYTGSGTVGKDGVFYDAVRKIYCHSGTSYSDKAAIRARQMATTIKNAGVKIFSIGVDVAGQTIQKHIDNFADNKSTSVVDRTGTTYELGDPSSTQSFKDWLGDKIGSGYYYDSTNTTQLKEAWNQIFDEIQKYNQQTSQDKWVTKDPLPLASEKESAVEFIGFYDQQGNFLVYPSASLSGSHAEGAENTAYYDEARHVISWDLKSSGYNGLGAGNVYQYNYYLRYRVRLRNERDHFVENTRQDTNGLTTLTFQTITTVNGVSTLGQTQVLEFPYPAVKGYLGELTFTKVGSTGAPVAGAEFTLTHDTASCGHCRGDYMASVPNVLVGETATLAEGEADCISVTSGADGVITFKRIPSGHVYKLEETKVPNGFAHNGSTYRVDVAYDTVTVTETTVDGSTNVYTIGVDTMNVVNITSYIMPSTGGVGIIPYMLGGLLCIAVPLRYKLSQRRRRRRDDE